MASTLTNLLVHVVFSTKNREPLLVSAIRSEIERYIGGMIHNEGGICFEIGGMPDHLHILMKTRADASISDLVRLIKTNSSRWAGERLRGFGWQTGYGAFSVSASQAEAVRRYIRGQEEHHRTMTLEAEYRAFLDRHGITYDERYLWT